MKSPTIENRNQKHIKVSEIGESETLRTNATNVESGILEYVRRQMHRATATGEVIGQAIVFQEEMDKEMSIIEDEISSEEAFRTRR